MISSALLARHLVAQRWYSGSSTPERVVITSAWVEHSGWPALIRMIVEADGVTYQLVLGLRPVGLLPDWLQGHDRAVVGLVSQADLLGSGLTVAAHSTGLTESGPELVAYDAVFDPELAPYLLAAAAPGETTERFRVMTVEQSNTSLVFDERIIVKLFRRPVEGPNPEVEMTEALVAQGFEAVAAPLGAQRRAGYDLAIAQPFLAGGVDGWALALTSLRDLFGVHDTAQVPIIDFDGPPPSFDPGQAGGDFSGEARRLGETTAAMHVALAESLGRHRGDPAAWSEALAKRVESVENPEFDLAPAERIIEAFRQADGGPSLRVHGDFHLGQVMRTDAGWYVLDFEGEPASTVEERRRPSSPLRDVAGMLRSFHYAAAVACGERDDTGWELGMAWEARNREAFLDGYLPAAARAGILPGDDRSIRAVLVALELEKAAYELAYERAYRPEWEAIPLAALRRLTRS